MKKIAFYTTFFLLLITTACMEVVPPDHTSIQGKVLEFGSNKPISGAKVNIEHWVLTGFLSGYHYTIDTVFTDDNGKYYWDTKYDPDSKSEGGNFQVGKITKDKYFDVDVHQNPNYTAIDANYLDRVLMEDVYMEPVSYFHLIVKDVPEIESEYCRVGGSIIGNAFNLFNEDFEGVYRAFPSYSHTLSYRYFYNDTMKIIPIQLIPFDTLTSYLEY